MFPLATDRVFRCVRVWCLRVSTFALTFVAAPLEVWKQCRLENLKSNGPFSSFFYTDLHFHVQTFGTLICKFLVSGDRWSKHYYCDKLEVRNLQLNGGFTNVVLRDLDIKCYGKKIEMLMQICIMMTFVDVDIRHRLHHYEWSTPWPLSLFLIKTNIFLLSICYKIAKRKSPVYFNPLSRPPSWSCSWSSLVSNLRSDKLVLFLILSLTLTW